MSVQVETVSLIDTHVNYLSLQAKLLFYLVSVIASSAEGRRNGFLVLVQVMVGLLLPRARTSLIWLLLTEFFVCVPRIATGSRLLIASS